MEYSTLNYFSYSYYDEEAETKIDSLLMYTPLLILSLNALIPGFADKFRRNNKVPFIGKGPHELTKGLIFNGTITKGKTYEGEKMSPILVDTDGDGVEDTEADYYEILARSTFLDHIEKNVEMNKWEFLKISLYRFFYWRNPNYIPYDI